MIEPRQREWNGFADWSKVPDIEARIPALLEYCRTHYADHELMVLDERRVTYGDICARSAIMARQLLAAGVGKGTRVGMLFPNTPEFIITWLGITRIGAVAVPISTLSTAQEIQRIARHSSLHLLISTDRHLRHDYVDRIEWSFDGEAAQRGAFRLPGLPFLRGVWIWGDKIPAWGSAVDLSKTPDVDTTLLAAAESAVFSSDPISIIYTSGSTADPKGVIHTHGNFLRQGARLAAIYPYRDDERIFTQMPFFWVGGLTLTLLPLMHVGTTLLCSTMSGAALLDFCEHERMTYMLGWPHLARAMADDPTFTRRDWSAMRGGRLHELLPGAARPRNHFANTLGMTETCGSHHIAHPELPDDLPGSMGTPIPGTERRIVDIETGRVITDETPGVLQVRGDAVAVGMVNRERADIFDPDGWYSTGDLCSVRKDHLFFHGRVDDMIKSSGANVSPREVEAALMALPGVGQANVFAVSDATRGSVVGAIIVPKPGATLDADAIRTQAAQSLSVYKVPRTIAFVEAAKVPMLSSSKIDRRALIKLLQETHAGK